MANLSEKYMAWVGWCVLGLLLVLEVTVQHRGQSMLFLEEQNIAAGLDLVRSCRCPIPGRAQGQAGWDSGQPDLLGGNSACVWGFGIG